MTDGKGYGGHSNAVKIASGWYDQVMADKQNVIAEALRLSEPERLEVAEAVYQSLEGPPDPDAAQAWSAEIERRVQDIDAGRVRLVPWSEARRQIAGDDDHGGSSVR